MTYWVGLNPKTRVHVTSITEARKLAVAMLKSPGMEEMLIPIYKSASSKKAVGWVEMGHPGHYNYIVYNGRMGAGSFAIKTDGTPVR